MVTSKLYKAFFALYEQHTKALCRVQVIPAQTSSHSSPSTVLKSSFTCSLVPFLSHRVAPVLNPFRRSLNFNPDSGFFETTSWPLLSSTLTDKSIEAKVMVILSEPIMIVPLPLRSLMRKRVRSVRDTQMLEPEVDPGQYQYSLGDALERMKKLII